MEMTVCSVQVKIGLSDVGTGTILFLQCEAHALWAVCFRAQRMLITTHKHFPKSTKPCSRDEVITINLMAVLPAVEYRLKVP